MRQIATIPDEGQARTLTDYLLTRGIEAKLQQEPAGWEIWVRDEDRVESARAELNSFLANPSDPRFSEAARTAANIRRSEERAEEQYRRRQADLAKRMQSPGTGTFPLTVGLIVACAIVSLVTEFGKQDIKLFGREDVQPTKLLSISPYEQRDDYIVFPGLTPIAHGQVWRLFTPVLLHFGPLHLLGNMMWLYYLGSEIESRRGSWRFATLVLALAAITDLCEYFLGGLRIGGGGLVMHYQPQFGGMSGVVFGLFGYVWMKMRYEPGLGLGLSQQAFVLSLLWFFFCFTGRAGSIANASHTSGLIVGIVVGAAPTFWRRLRS
jgi:GlpG protein